MLAERNGIPMPKRTEYSDAESKLRGALLEMHAIAARAVSSESARSAGRGGAGLLAKRGVSPEMIETFELGYAEPPARLLRGRFRRRNISRRSRWKPPGWCASATRAGILRLLPRPPDVSDSQRVRQGDRLRRAGHAR